MEINTTLCFLIFITINLRDCGGMMRTIKARAYDKISNTWMYQYFIDGQLGMWCSFHGNGGVNYDLSEWQEYTGLKDKNGVEIYEGDIVSGSKGDFVGNVIGIVKYSGMSFVFEGTTSSNRYDISGGCGPDYWRYHVTSDNIKILPEIEVIGNLRQNPELLRSEK